MERLQKVIARAGIASRRKAEQLILGGKVTVNGQIVTELGTKVSSKDIIEVEGIKVEKEEPVYFLLYKPRGVLSTVSDDKGRKTVIDFFPELDYRIFPVGRLDFDTSGLILLTNDGDLANKLMHPKFEMDKTYIAKVKGIPSRRDLKKLQNGIQLEDGVTAPAKVKFRSGDRKKGTAIIEITIHEGRNRQVRRMFDAIGYPVLKLKRERYAFLTLDGLAPGEYRPLSPHEVKQLKILTQQGRIN
ncbi:pseudouridine synthase [Fervidibacillus halotolerans]|uniref:Pseudouridine synthase n=1 Tax=Fervidibacillus halotolerans TaxID=2980027 RepID=A0A9E8S1S1_9BACI|nr:pseudouridine synthase [Fervidibacillus halotolerans]WAA13802.1 rRNA pseudouridine synthase [Fervidibacillus halotolerans]